MTTELYKKTEETTMVDGQPVKETTLLETIIKDDNGNEIGRLNVSKWGANFSINIGNLDVQAISDGIINVINPTA